MLGGVGWCWVMLGGGVLHCVKLLLYILLCSSKKTGLPSMIYSH